MQLKVESARVDPRFVCGLCGVEAYTDLDQPKPSCRTQHPSFHGAQARDLYWVNSKLCEVCYFTLIMASPDLKEADEDGVKEQITYIAGTREV